MEASAVGRLIPPALPLRPGLHTLLESFSLQEGSNMSEKKELVAIEDLQIEALTDEELDSVAGGYGDANSHAESCMCCTETATNHGIPIQIGPIDVSPIPDINIGPRG
ncbi:MAG: hypothetical protein AAF772_00350 [Acidobacteriota bacterium]